jgi:pilus assembly protein CpaB
MRALLLLGLAALLGGLAASDVARREAALRDALGPSVPVLVARRDVAAGARLTRGSVAVRRVPQPYAPRVRFESPHEVDGLRAAVAIAARTDVTPAMIDDGRAAAVTPPVRPGERVADIVAIGAPQLIGPGSRVDVLVTRERGDGSGATSVALSDAEVLAAAPAPPADGQPADRSARVALSLRVTARQAVFLAAAQDFARQLRVLPRARGDRGRGIARLRVDSRLRW